MTTSADLFAQWAAISAIVMALVSVFKPFLEQAPFARPTATLHDPIIRLFNLGLSLAVVLALAVSSTQRLSGAAVVPYVMQTIAYWSGAQGLYHLSTRSGGSVGGAPIASPASMPASAPADPTSAAANGATTAQLAASVAGAVSTALGAATSAEA